MSKHLYIYSILFLLSFTSLAQNVPHINSWGRFSISQPISEKWRAEVEIQHRRQNDYAQQTKDLNDKNLLSSARLWVHYQHKDDLSFSFSPFSYYWHNSIIVKEEDKLKPQTKEIRFSIAADLKHEVVKKLWIIDRTCIEYRDYQNTTADIVRLRNRLGLRYDFNAKWNFTFYDEVFINLNGVDPIHIFDHNRIAFVLTNKPNNHIKMEAGYIYISRLPKGSDEFLNENNLLFHLYYTLPHNQHRHSSKTQHHS